MRLRCSPGDLVVVVRTAPSMQEFLGRIFRVTELDSSMLYPPCWRTEPEIWKGNTLILADDPSIRPICPGADPVDIDEPLKVPEKVEA